MHDDVRAEINRPAQVRRSEGIVDHQRKAVLMRDGGYSFDIEYVAARVADRLGENAARIRRNGFAEVFGVVRLDEGRVQPEFRKLTSNCV